MILWWRPTVQGVHNVPSSGPVILAANHLANIDSVIVPCLTPRKVRYIIKADFWRQSGLVAKIKQRFFEAIGSIPVDRGTLRSAQGSLDTALVVLNDGGVFGIYPEGTRSKDGKLGKAHTGIAWLIEKSHATVIPVGLIGTNDMFVPGKTIPPRNAQVTVRFGSPLDFSDIDAALPESQRRKAITARVMDGIQQLSEQEPRPQARKELP